MTLVEIRGITKSYTPGVPVLRPINLTIRPGELFFLLGPSGCGKSTLLRILAGLVTPDAGAIAFNGRDITTLPPEKRRAAMVFQNYALWPHMSVFENVAFGLRTAGEKRAAIETKVTEALATVRMLEYAARRVPSLSGGQQQRVALARALAVDPALLLLDEPLSNLDARLRDEMRHEIRRICKERNLTALYVTHDRQEALSMADRVAVMDRGVIIETASPEEIYQSPAHRFTASFLGNANFITGKVVSAAGEDHIAATTAGEMRFSNRTSFPPGQEVTLMIRPERVCLDPPAEALNVLNAEIASRTFTGESCEWELRAGGLELTAVEMAPPPRRVGDAVRVALPPAHLIAIRDAESNA